MPLTLLALVVSVAVRILCWVVGCWLLLRVVLSVLCVVGLLLWTVCCVVFVVSWLLCGCCLVRFSCV